MRLKKYVLSFGLISILAATGLVVDASNESSISQSITDITSYYNNLMDNNGIEHVKLTYSNGEYLDMYRDTENKLDQVDYYDEYGNLNTRDITLNNGSTILTLGNDGSGEFSIIETDVPNDLAQQNKDLLQNSIIDSFFNEESGLNLTKGWNQVRSDDTEVIKYSSENGNIYINAETGELEKREIYMNGELYQTLEFDVIDKNTKLLNNLFKLNAPFSSNTMRSNIDLESLDYIECDGGESEEDYPDDINGVG